MVIRIRFRGMPAMNAGTGAAPVVARRIVARSRLIEAISRLRDLYRFADRSLAVR